MWIGVGAGAAIGIAGLVLLMVVMRMAAPADDPPNAVQNVAAAAALPGGEAPAAASAPLPPSPPSTSGSLKGSSPAPTPASVSSATPPANQPVSSIGPSSPFSPPQPAAPPEPAAPAASRLGYRFKSGEEYAYSFTVKADVAGTANQASGLCTLSLSRDAPPAEFAAQEKSGQGNGSGFVVTNDGYVVTCAHVVEGSTKIEVVLGQQTYPAQVFAFDKEHDLAVVRIVAANLPTLSLADSDAVELAQEVRAVGFPLSHVLGDSVKINRGAIAGIVDTSGHKLLQVDASINPGNSGGPLVNEMGQVVGVASAKLTGEDVDGVGFAVPANEVLALLKGKGISPTPAAAGPRLDGPALARSVIPAVALIKVTIGPGGYGVANRLLLDFSGQVTSSGPPRDVGRIRLPGIPNTESDRGKLMLSERGEVLHSTGNVQLPYLLGPLGALAIEPLGDGERRNWQTRRTVLLTQTIGQETHNSWSMRFRHRARRPFAQGPFGQSQAKVVVTPAIETCDYELTGASGELASLRKRYTFQTVQSSGEPPIAKVTGEGTITFNRGQGHAEKMEYKATLVRSASNVSVTVPLTMEWRRLSQSELDRLRAQAKANLEAARQASAERAARAAKRNIGEDTEFAGGPGGAADRFVDETAMLYGVECTFSEWMREQCLNKIVPIFARDQQRTLPAGEVARKGYAVGAVKVYSQTFVNGMQLVFMRVRDGRRLDPKDSYTGKLIGVRGPRKPATLSGDGAPIIGIHVRRGLIVDALALVVDRGASSESPEPPKKKASPSKGAASNRRAGRPASRTAVKTIANSLGMKLALVPRGKFSMGSDEAADSLEKAFQTGETPSSNFSITVSVGKEGDPPLMPSTFDPPGFPEFAKPKGYAAEQPKHQVRITKPFYLGAYEVTKGQFRKFVDATGYKTDAEKDGKGGWLWVQEAETLVQKPEYDWRAWESDGGEDHPVVNVTWNDAAAFCEWLSAQESKTYRLPTEAEWEYACRAGADSRFYNGDDEAALLKIGNVRGFRLELVSETKQKGFTHTRMAPKPKDGYVFTAPVGRFRPNGFGLYDMTGNVSEWCGDCFDAQYYVQSPSQDPPGPARGGARVIRGGGWDSAPIRARSAFRSGAAPTDRFGSIGFRVAREE